MESYYVEDIRIYDCRIQTWERAQRCDFLDGQPAERVHPERVHRAFVNRQPQRPRACLRNLNIRTLLKTHYCHISDMHLKKNREAPINTAAYDFFNIPCHSMKKATSYILSILNIPEENRKSMEEQILNYAKNFLMPIRHYSIFFMTVVVNVDIFYHYNCDPAIETFMSKNQACKLKGVQLQEDEGLSDNCSICLKDLRVDAVQMPCSHFFHGNCIVNWLLKKSNCPLCRFEIASSQNRKILI
ncbi:hypothetical protein K1719_002306 [Acacia pycnantha]|nr:hypothetical protein K1719_002306 [Acacia pycnantha]